LKGDSTQRQQWIAFTSAKDVFVMTISPELQAKIDALEDEKLKARILECLQVPERNA